MKTALTASFVQAVKSRGDQQLDIYDTRTRGFLLRVSPAGKKSWGIFYRHQRTNRRLTIGPYPEFSLADARKEAQKKLRDAAHGLDPAGEKRRVRDAETFGQLCVKYLEQAKEEKRTWREDERMIEKDLLPAWKNRKARELTRGDVKVLLERIVDRGSPIAANRTLALISTIFNYGIEEDAVIVNPAYRLPKPSEERERDRVLREDEIRTLWNTLEDEPLVVAAAFKLGLLTAQRRGEILGAAWDEIDFETAMWTIPAARAKNKASHRVPLTREALILLKELSARAPSSPWVFAGPRQKPITNPQKWARRVRKRSGLDFKYHDLRRSAASQMTGVGIPRLVVSKLLNHKERGVTRVYDRHSYDAEKRSALARWERRLLAIISDEQRTSNVVALGA
jgi:integrase